jgi:hypothetical protein
MHDTEAWKGTFVNDLIRDLQYESYLELGIANAATWSTVICQNKVGVDNNSSIQVPGVICNTTDEYFESLNSSVKFDLIFIDAYHEKHQVKRDFCNSWSHLNPGGIIVMHDINPQSSQATQQTAAGDCFAFWIGLVNAYKSRLAVFSGGTLCGEYDSVGLYYKKDETIDSNNLNVDHSYEYFDTNRETLIRKLELPYNDIILKHSQFK